jgi:acetyltransferase-like isoleucine patch superfamily enzyme/dTDP-4-dehydrorhamnose 3,5-epimerase-like enzyme
MKNTFIHPNALCETTHVGNGTRIYAFSHILSGAVIGDECNICDHVFIENEVHVGNRVTIKCGVQLWNGINIADDVFIGPNVTFTNDKYPRSKKYPLKYACTEIRKGASLGANATILPGITVGEGSMVGAGAVVTRSVPRDAIVYGNPARIIGYTGIVNMEGDPFSSGGRAVALQHGPSRVTTSVPGVNIHTLPVVKDMRGDLVVGEFMREIPISVKRFFMIHGVSSREVRGEHAHRECHQFLICTRGNVSVIEEKKKNRTEILLDSPSKGVHLPPMIWGIQYKYSEDAVLMVFASDYYNSDDYIREYDEFKKIALN